MSEKTLIPTANPIYEECQECAKKDEEIYAKKMIIGTQNLDLKQCRKEISKLKKAHEEWILIEHAVRKGCATIGMLGRIYVLKKQKDLELAQKIKQERVRIIRKLADIKRSRYPISDLEVFIGELKKEILKVDKE